MSLSKEALKKYAELGVRERLREIQRELDVLARDFPHLVHNADGSMPSVIPIVATKKPTVVVVPHGHMRGSRNATAQRQQQAAAYLAAHPGTTAQVIAAAIGMKVNGSLREKVLQPIAVATGKGTSTSPRTWTLKARANGQPKPRGTKIRQRRQASADLLARFDTATPRKVKSNRLGILIQRGYLVRKDDGYLRTAKPYHVHPNGAAAS